MEEQGVPVLVASPAKAQDNSLLDGAAGPLSIQYIQGIYPLMYSCLLLLEGME